MKGLIDDIEFMSSYHIAIILLSICISACTPRSEMLFLDPYNAIISATSVHQQKSFALDVLFVVESSNNNFSNKKILNEHIGYFLRVLLSQKKVIDFHVGFTLASASLDFRNRAGGFEFFMNENLDEMFPSDIFYVETVQNVLETDGINNQSFFDGVLRVLSSNNAIENGFYRDEADLLLVFIGEDDQSDNMNAKSLSQELLELKKYEKDKVNVLSIYPIVNKCPSSENLSVRNIKELTRILNGHVLHLCAPIFDKLLQAAQIIYQNVASIPLTRIPLLETVALCHGSNTISQGTFEGWVYLPQSNKIALAWDVYFNSSFDDSDDRLNLQSTRDSNFRLSCKSNRSSIDTSPHLFDLTYMSASPSHIAKNLLSLKEKPASVPSEEGKK